MSIMRDVIIYKIAALLIVIKYLGVFFFNVKIRTIIFS